jgi:hypothetical protein
MSANLPAGYFDACYASTSDPWDSELVGMTS